MIEFDVLDFKQAQKIFLCLFVKVVITSGLLIHLTFFSLAFSFEIISKITIWGNMIVSVSALLNNWWKEQGIDMNAIQYLAVHIEGSEITDIVYMMYQKNLHFNSLKKQYKIFYCITIALLLLKISKIKIVDIAL